MSYTHLSARGEFKFKAHRLKRKVEKQLDRRIEPKTRGGDRKSKKYRITH